MDYEKLHKDTINKLQQMVNSGKITVEIARGICADFVPESKDERIRKSLATYFANFKPDYMWDDDFSFGDIVAWLEKQGGHAKFINGIQVGDKVTRNEDGVLVNLSQLNRVAKKQGEQKPLVIPKFRKGDFIRYKTNPDDVKRVDCVMDNYYILDIKGECTHVLFTCQDLWELVEQKPADKVEPKFHKGDWILHHGTENIYQVVAVIDNQYQLKYGDNYTTQYCEDVDRCTRLYDVTKDAKDGDVLVSSSGKPFIFKGFFDNDPMAYGGLVADDSFWPASNSNWTTVNCKPATKEQRDLLFQKIKEAGYEWDAEKKELSRLEEQLKQL